MKYWLVAIFVSSILHVVFVANLESPRFPGRETLKVKIVEVKKPEPPKEEVPPPPPPPPPKPKPKPKSERAPDKPPEQPPQQVMGVSPDSVQVGGNGISVPLGNTMMDKDRGIRLTPDELKGLEKDLSSEPRLVVSSIAKPEYTSAANDAGLERVVRVDVYVDEMGDVTDTDITDKIGYGMDDRVLASVRKAKFFPRRDKTGRAIPGWTVINFSLEID